MTYSYYDNSHSCGNCNGEGCRVCFGDLLNPNTGDLWKLRGQGRERFPLSRMINGCQPPYIQQPYAGKLGWFQRGGVWLPPTPQKFINHARP